MKGFQMVFQSSQQKKERNEFDFPKRKGFLEGFDGNLGEKRDWWGGILNVKVVWGFEKKKKWFKNNSR